MLYKSKKEALEKGASFYYTGKVCCRGHYSPRYVASGACVECTALNNKHYNEKVRSDPKLLISKRTQHREYCRTNLEKTMLHSARRRAKVNNMAFDITESDIVIPTHCPILGIKLEAGTARKHRNSPSLDRINNSEGYIKGNVHVISDKANSIKNDASLEEIEKLYFYLKDLYDSD